MKGNDHYCALKYHELSTLKRLVIELKVLEIELSLDLKQIYLDLSNEL